MKVVLLQNIENLGKKHEVKEVADGYARNFLLPNNLAKLATVSAVIEVEDFQKKKEEEAEKDLEMVQELASQLDGLELEMKVKVAKNGKLYAAINSERILQAMRDRGIETGKARVVLKEPIKNLGEYEITIEMDHGLEANIKLIISEEKKEGD